MIRVNSEVERLRRVVVHPPGPAHERMMPEHIVPESPQYLLFDDLVDVPAAQAEHRELCEVLSSVAEVVYLQELLAEVLQASSARASLVEAVAGLHRLPDSAQRAMCAMSGADLAATMVVGTLGGAVDGQPLFHPAPNLIFTRDLAAVVGELVIVGNASKRARQRETLMSWAVVGAHPVFGEGAVSRVSQRVHEGGGSAPLTVEGGDVLVISSSLVCIGASERTSWAMIIALADELLDSGFTRVLVVEMPKQRSSMHLDTVFTMASWDTGVVYSPLLERGGREEAKAIRLRRVGSATVVEDLDCHLFEALALEGHPLSAIQCGGGHPIHARREQWTDGANYVALGPGVVIGYARNRHTAKEMAQAGFEVITPARFLAVVAQDFGGDGGALIDSGRRIAVHLTGSELSRGRGGPRCLTMPLWRDG
jgi:arginine deiminase